MSSTEWLDDTVERYAGISGYEKPALHGNALRLDSNENLLVPKQFLQGLMVAARKEMDIRQYPLGTPESLVSALSEYLGVPAGMIGLGNGSDQILDLILGNIATKKTRILVSDPTFGFFEARCRLYDIPVTRVPFSDSMTLDISLLEKEAGSCDIMYLDSPNNPTGFQFPRDSLTRLIKSFEGLVIIDEAYAEFSGYSLAKLPRTVPNLIVVRTFSKSFGLAGLRLGYLVAGKKLAGVFNDVIQYPYPVNSVALAVGRLALECRGQVESTIGLMRSERARIISALREYKIFEVFDSEANFVLFDAGSADARVHKALLEQGIAVRRLGRIGGRTGCLRVTVGTKEMNSRFLLAIRDLLQ